MVDFVRLCDNQCELSFDLSIFNENVVTKVMYWINNSYITYWQSKNETLQTIRLEKKKGIIDKQEFQKLKEDISQLFIDFKTRDIINKETKNIRDILFVKAFANNDDFEDFTLIP